MNWNRADDVIDFIYAFVETVIFSAAVQILVMRGIQRFFVWRVNHFPRRERWPYRLLAEDMRVYRQATAIRRFLGSPQTPSVRSGQELVEWRHSVAAINAIEAARKVWQSFPAFIAIVTVIVYDSTPYSPTWEGVYWGGMLGALTCGYMAKRFTKRIYESEGGRYCLWQCAKALQACYLAAKRDSNAGFFSVDRTVKTLCSELGEYANYWESDNWRSDMGRHTARVQNALRESVGGVLRGGHEGLPDTVRVLGILLDRLISERWLALLDENDMPEYQGELIMPVVGRHKDYWVGAISILTTIALITGALFLGDLDGAGQVLPFLIFPILLLGTDRLRERVMSVFRGGSSPS
ncbi:hypothetical protein ACWGKQ_49525 [Streptomyces sp. NPDC054770]